MNKLVKIASQIDKPGMAKVIMITEPDLKVKGRTTKIPLPEKFKGLRKVTVGTFPIGYEYCAEGKGVERQLEASGASPENFTVQKASGMHQASDNGVVYESDKNPDQKYIRLYKKNGKLESQSEVSYINPDDDEVEVSKDEYSEYFPAPSKPNKQLEAGMDADKVVLPMSPKVESILYLKKGELVYDALTAKLKRLLKKLFE